MASLSSLRRDLRYWRNQADDLEGEIRRLKRRRRDVESVKSALKSAADHNSNDVNRRLRASGQKLDNAINHSGKESQLNAILSGKDEQNLGLDSSLSSAEIQIQRELYDIDRQLNEAEERRSRAKDEVRDLKAEIAMEERRERE